MAAASSTGLVRRRNEDSAYAGRWLCAVAGWAGLFMTVTAFAEDAITPGDLPLDQVAGLPLDGAAAGGAGPGPGFLTGDAGYALALHALAAGAPPATRWDTCLRLR